MKTKKSPMREKDRPKILVVDDEPLSIELLAGVLSKDYEIIRAYSGNEAISKVEKTFPDLVLLDILMADMNGYDLCLRIKSNDRTRSIPVIMLTVLREKEERIEAINAGADDFLIKPVDIDILSARVNSLLKVKQYYDTLKSMNKSGSGSLTNRALRDPSDPMPGCFNPLKPEVSVELQKAENIEMNRGIRGVMSADDSVLNDYPCPEGIIKNHLGILILRLLSDRPMCGYELIKEIFIKYNVLLSQGTVYPFLYSLRKEGILYAQFMKGNMRTKIYSVTQEGRQIIEKRINEFINAEEYLLDTIKNRETWN